MRVFYFLFGVMEVYLKVNEVRHKEMWRGMLADAVCWMV